MATNEEKYKNRARYEAKKIKIPENQKCEICKEKIAIERHHPDYNHPVDIIFVCKSCHGKMKELQTKERIIEYLKKKEDLIHLKNLSIEIKISYPIVLKHCDVLAAEGRIKMKDYGNVKLVKVNGQKNH